MRSWMRAGPGTVTAICRHLLVLARASAHHLGVPGNCSPRTGRYVKGFSARPHACGGRAQLTVQGEPLSVNRYGVRLASVQEPRKPKDRVPCAATALL